MGEQVVQPGSRRAVSAAAIAILLAALVGPAGNPAGAAPGGSVGGKGKPPKPTVSACGTDPLKADGSRWSCTFADDFDGSTLDGRRWMVATTEATGLSYGDCWTDAPANVQVANGSVRLTTRRESEPVTCTAAGRTITSSHTSGSITTWGRFTMDQGRVEVRARMPSVTEPGVQSALWLFPQTLEYADSLGTGEIDVAEYYSQYPDRLVPMLHYGTTSQTYTNNGCLVADPSAWHTYAVEWDRSRVRVLYDGQTCLDHEISTAGASEPGQPFDQDYTINLTQMLGSGANAPTASTPFPATLEVDHVRAWT